MIKMISVFNITKNRLENLEKCWRTWLFADEIIILDYNSDIPIEINHPKVKVYRVEDKDFCLSKACNIAVSLCSGNVLIKADSDYYFNDIPPVLKKQEFYSGRGVDKYVDGFVMLWKKDFERVNGYNERMIYYGWEDIDFYNRLGIKENKIKKGLITHLPHSDRSRIQAYGIDGRKEKHIEHYIQINKKTMLEQPWSIKDRRSIYGKNI